jgi:hypothetical protein
MCILQYDQTSSHFAVYSTRIDYCLFSNLRKEGIRYLLREWGLSYG